VAITEAVKIAVNAWTTGYIVWVVVHADPDTLFTDGLQPGAFLMAMTPIRFMTTPHSEWEYFAFIGSSCAIADLGKIATDAFEALTTDRLNGGKSGLFSGFHVQIPALASRALAWAMAFCRWAVVRVRRDGPG